MNPLVRILLFDSAGDTSTALELCDRLQAHLSAEGYAGDLAQAKQELTRLRQSEQNAADAA